MKKIVWEGFAQAAVLILIGALVMAGMRVAEWVIPRPETRVVVCMSDDVDEVICKPLVALMAAVQAKAK